MLELTVTAFGDLKEPSVCFEHLDYVSDLHFSASFRPFHVPCWPRSDRLLSSNETSGLQDDVSDSEDAWAGVILFGRLLTFYRPNAFMWCEWCWAAAVYIKSVIADET